MNPLYQTSPCDVCVRVADPEQCENKTCQIWKKWFLWRWALLHDYPRRQMEKPRPLVGVEIGGVCYAAPDQVRRYLAQDPCRGCSCGADICKTPCRARQAWAKAGGEAVQ